MPKKSKLKKRSYKSDTKDIMDLATLAVKANVVLGVANIAIGATKK